MSRWTQIPYLCYVAEICAVKTREDQTFMVVETRNKRPTIVGVFAHPDDESFGPGGTLAKYAAEGADVHVIIATDGIAGSVEVGTTIMDHETLAQIRSGELSNAATALGVTSIWSLPYRDSGMRGTPENDHPQALIQQPRERLVGELMDYMQRLQPDVVITHDPLGGYGHPDHICVCETATAAFHQLRSLHPDSTGVANNGNGYTRPQKLYYTAFDKRLLKIVVRLMPLFGKDPTAFGRNKDINFAEIARWEAPIHTRINIRDYEDRKLAASVAHVSQYGGGPSYLRILPQIIRRRTTSYDNFMRAFPPPSSHTETDLLSGLNGFS